MASDAREPKQKKKAKTISPTIKFIDRAGNDTELPRLKRSHKLRAWIAVDQSIDPHQDAGPAVDILKAIDPVTVLVGFLDAHDVL